MIGMLGVAQAAAGVQILRHEPGNGRLHAGQAVLVDDGSCPKGQVKEVKAGANRSVSSNAKLGGSKRTYRCVPHP
ncbi:hypothetical protein LGH82_25090 [Mesorhizobium sp. PAMC28654]|nr:hypothetical protein LGH82_25090 [Mesorhizobium sp. PAMC28654]